MKLNTHALRYLTADDWRVLTAVEMGSKNHEVVPTPLIQKISGLRAASGVQRAIAMLAKSGLIAKVKNAKCMSIIQSRFLPTEANLCVLLQTTDTA